MIMATKANILLERKNNTESRYGIRINNLGNFYVVDLKNGESASKFEDNQKLSKARR